MNKAARGARYRLDFITNPAYIELTNAIQAMATKEMRSLQSAGRGESEHKFNHQAGIVDGVEHVQLLMVQLEEQAKRDMEGDAKEPIVPR